MLRSYASMCFYVIGRSSRINSRKGTFSEIIFETYLDSIDIIIHHMRMLMVATSLTIIFCALFIQCPYPQPYTAAERERESEAGYFSHYTYKQELKQRESISYSNIQRYINGSGVLKVINSGDSFIQI